MKKNLLFLFVLLVSLGNYVSAQSTVVVADGTATNSYLPVYGLYMDENLHSQFIYPAADVATLSGSAISKLTFYATPTSDDSDWGTATCVISIGTPTESSFASAAYNTTTLTQVYSGTIAVVNGIMEFTFTTPYLFPGGNMLVDFQTTTSGDYSVVTFLGNTATNGGYYTYTYGGGVQQFLPKATFEYMGGSSVVITSSASAINATSATLNGSYFNMTSTTYGFQYMLASSSDWTSATTVTATANPMSEIITSLTPTTSYKFRAFANDGTANVYGDEKTFTTLAIPAYLPYTCDFENPTENAEWAFINGTQVNQFVIGDASFNPDVNNTLGGTNAVYISNDAGLSWAYTLATSATPSRVYAYRDFYIDPGVTEVKLTLDWKAMGNGYGDFLRIYWVPTNSVITPGVVPPGALDVSNALGTFYNSTNNNIHLNLASTWQSNEFIINTTQFPTLAGNTWRMLVHWRNENTGAAVQPPATVDNITLTVQNCPTPTALAATNITTSGMDIAWTENGTALAWNLQYKLLSSSTWTTVQTSTNPHIFTGLNPSSTYQFRVQSDCGTEQSFYTAAINVNTTCGVISQLPWSEGFEFPSTWPAAVAPGNTVAQNCWFNINGGYASEYYKWQRTTSPVRTGSGALQFYGGYNTPSASSIYVNNDWFISPIITLTGNERLSFYANSNNPTTYMDDIAVYVFSIVDNQLIDIATVSDTSLFDLVMPATLVTATGANWQQFEVNLSAYTGDVRFAFVRNIKRGGLYLNIDDIKVDALPTCLRPTAITVSNINAYGADFDWIPGDPNNTTCWIYYKPVVGSDWDSVQVFDNPYTLNILNPSTNYQYYMKTDCGSELSEATNMGTFMTSCVPVSILPWSDGFESITAANTLPPCWAATGFGSKTGTQITNYNSYNRNARTGTRAAYFVWGCNDRFFTPGFELEAGVAYEFNFWYVTDGLGNWTTLQSGVYSQQNANSLINTMTTINLPPNTTYQEAVSYFTPTTDGVYYFGIYCNSTTAPYYLTIDDISLDLAPNCLPVQQLAVTNVAGTSAYASWLPAGTPDSYNVEISETGSGIWTPYFTTDPFYVLTGLSELTSYSVQVYPNCSGLDGPRDTVDFTTICAAGGDLIIGTPGATTSTNGGYFPTQTYYKYSYTQQIIDATELGSLDSIHTIAFQYFYASAISRNLTIYLAHTTQSTFSSTSNYIPGDSLQQVFQGSVTFNNSGAYNWFTITLPVGFEYDGVSNLVLAVQDNTGSYMTNADKFRTHAVSGNKGLYFHQDGSAISTTFSPSAGSSGVSTFRNNIKISLPCETVTCYQPNVILTDVTSSSASMIIVPGGSETSWEAEYKAITETAWTSLSTVTSPYVLPGLSSNTTYSVRFRTVCSGSDMSDWKTVTFTTDCGSIMQLPLVENFDTYGQGSNIIPTCWTRNSTAGSYPYITSSYPISTPYSLYFYSTGSTSAIVVLPPVDVTIPINTLQLSFMGRMYTAGNNLQVGVMTNPNDASTFTLVATVAPSVLDAYEELFVSFANYTDTGLYIAIRSDLSSQGLSNTMYVDNLVLDVAPNCVKPTDVVFTAITTTTATASWTPSATAVSYEVVYGLVGLDPLTATPVAVNDTFIDIDLLTATTLYQFYVRSVCSSGDFSDWTFLRTFTTVALAPVPYAEPFTLGTTPIGYNLTGFTVGSDYNNVVPGNPAPNIYINLYSYNNTGSFSTINMGPLLPNYELAFEYKVALYSGGSPVPVSSGNFVVAISTDWGDTYTNVDTVDNNGLPGYQSYSFDLSAYDTEIIKIKIIGNWAAEDYYLAFDNIYVGPAITCPYPSALVASSPTTTSINLAWTENGTATAWEVEYGAPGFAHGAGTIVPATSTSVTIPSLTPSTTYDFYVRAVCGVGDESMWSAKVTAATTCLPTNLPFTENFDAATIPACWSQTYSGGLTSNRWSIGSDNEAGGTGNEMVSNWQSGIGISRLIAPGIDFTGVPNATLSFKHFYSDYDPGVTMKIQTSSDLTTWTDQPFSIIGGSGDVGPITTTVALTLTSGVNYIAWVIDGNHFSFNNWYIDNVSIIAATAACAVPTGLAVSAITPTTATATWTAGGTETSWEVAYKTTAASIWMTAVVSAATYDMTPLTASTAYDVKVRAICAPGDTSAYSAIVNFTTTTTPCAMPTNLQVTNITDQSAEATWTAGGSETSWNVEYKLVSSANWTSASTTTASFPIVGLQSASNYQVRVKAICSGTNESAFTTAVPFTTLGGGVTYTITATAGANGTITPSGAVMVNAGASQTFNFAANTGFMISAVVVDNTPEATQPTSYTFSNVVANHTIHVDFITTGIEENELAQLVELYPNPTSSTIELRINSEQLQVNECRIYDMYGKLMKVLPIHLETTTIDVTDFAAGVYFVRMESDKGIISKKFVKK